ncbi:MAG: hypothetical protein JKY95_15450 [Planctomycetaceae bacterium]|nr:hypothetical protein [Planctomycetaceae bacterium]
MKIDCLLGSSRNEFSIEIPDMHLRKCEINPRAFPWRLSELDATVSVLNGVVIFNELKAVHGLSEIRSTGSFGSNIDGWQLHFDKLEVDDLFPDHEFMAALPNEFRQLMESMKIEAPASVSGRLNLAGDYRDQSVEADWAAKIV